MGRSIPHGRRTATSLPITVGSSATTNRRSQSQVLNVTPNGIRRGPSGSRGEVWLPTAQEIFTHWLRTAPSIRTLDAAGFPVQGDYGNAFIKDVERKQQPSGDGLLRHGQHRRRIEWRCGSRIGRSDAAARSDGAQTGAVRQLAVGAGKDGHLYVVNRSNMGKFSMSNNAIWEDMPVLYPGGVWATPAYLQETVYYGSVGAPLKAFGIQQALLGRPPTSSRRAELGYPGTDPRCPPMDRAMALFGPFENSQPARVARVCCR